MTTENTNKQARFKRILLKISGEALLGDKEFGIDSRILNRLALEIKEIIDAGIEIAIVVGAGNLFRGAELAQNSGMERVTGDHMGMLATVMNSLALQDAIEKVGVPVRVMSAIPIEQVCEKYIRRRATRHMEKSRVVICAAGTGNPFFSTDTAASLRAIELNTDVMLKATKVDGIYDSDPEKNPDAKRYEALTYDDVISQNLQVMDTTAIVMCRDNQKPLLVFNMLKEREIINVLFDDKIGTIVS